MSHEYPIHEINFAIYRQAEDKYVVQVMEYKQDKTSYVRQGLVVKEHIDELKANMDISVIKANIEASIVEYVGLTDRQRVIITFSIGREYVFRCVISDENQEFSMQHWNEVVAGYGEGQFICMGDTFLLAEDFYNKQTGREIKVRRLMEDFEQGEGTTVFGKDLDEIEEKLKANGSDYLDRFYDLVDPQHTNEEEEYEQEYDSEDVDVFGVKATLVGDKNKILKTVYDGDIDDFKFIQENVILMFRDISEVAEFVEKVLTNEDIDLRLYLMENKYYLVINYPKYMDGEVVYRERVKLTEYYNFSGRTVEYLEEYGKLIMEDETIRGVLKTLR